MKSRCFRSVWVFAIVAPSVMGQVINIPQADLLPPGDPGNTPWIAADAGIVGVTRMVLVADPSTANWLLFDVQDNGFPAPFPDAVTDDVVVFPPESVAGATATMDVPPLCRVALFHDVYDETGLFLSGPNGILNDNPEPGTDDAYVSSNPAKTFSVYHQFLMVKYFLVDPAESYQFTNEYGAVTQLGTGYRAFIFIDDDHSPNFDFDDMIIGILPDDCTIPEDCDDGNLCNGPEDCVNGSCTNGTPLDCDDGVACNGTESCVGGSCQPGTPIECDDGDFCNGEETCENGECVDGTPPECDDGDFCNGQETCENDECVDGDPPVCDDEDFCNGLETCHPVDGCIPGTPPECDDGDACDGEETCSDNSCQPGTPMDCDDGDFCNGEETCENNECVGGTPPTCDDGDPCTVNECFNGSCQPAVPVDCSQLNTQCSSFTCDPNGAAGNCDRVTAVEDGAPCDDGLFCTGANDTCLGGLCIGGDAPDCGEPEGLCLVRECDAILDTCVSRPVQDGTECNDNNPCNVGEACLAGECAGGSPPDCSQQGGDCIAAACDPLGIEGNCETRTPLEQGTLCGGEVLSECDAADSCDGAGTCVSNFAPVDTSCGDDPESECDAADTCDGAGSCIPKFAPADTPCGTSADTECDHADTCDGSGDCRENVDPDGTTCDDADPCTTDESCQSGVCEGSQNYGLIAGSAISACLLGPDSPGIAEECECSDLNGDNQVDLRDVGIFQNLFTE